MIHCPENGLPSSLRGANNFPERVWNEESEGAQPFARMSPQHVSRLMTMINPSAYLADRWAAWVTYCFSASVSLSPSHDICAR